MPLPLSFLVLAVVQSWSIGGSDAEPVEAQLKRFEFEGKAVVLELEDGSETTVPTADLSLQNRVQLLLSPTFVAGYPKETWTPQQTRFVLLATLVPAFYFLAAFWMAAALVLKKASPLKAALAFIGGWLLGMLLIGSYVMIGARIGQSVIPVALFGLLVSSFFVSMYISVIYATTTWNGFLMFVCHFFLAVVLMALSAITVSAFMDHDKMDEILTEHVFEPVGMVAERQ